MSGYEPAQRSTFVWDAGYEVGPLRVWASRPLLLLIAFVPLGFLVPATVDDQRWLLALAAHCILAAILWRLTVRRCRLVVDELGVHDVRIFTTTSWSWDQVACLAVDSYGKASGHLVACIVGDPYPKTLKGAPQRDRAQADATLAQIGRRGWPVDSRTDIASTWWYLDTRSQPGRTERTN